MLRVVVIGLGEIGVAAAQALRAEAGIKLAGMVDTDPAKQGKTLFDLGWRPGAGTLRTPNSEDPGPTIVGTLDEAMAQPADVAIIATASHVPEVAATIHDALRHGLSVVTSCEEMIWPWYRHPHLAEELDGAAKRAGKAVLGVGVNPGFAMDLLAIELATMLRRVKRVTCSRRVNASLRRRGLQAKVGAGLSQLEFESLKTSGQLGHVGLAESACLLAAGLGRSIPEDAIEESLEPVIAREPVPSAMGLVPPGAVAGIHQRATWQGEGLEIVLDLTMAVGIDDTADRISLEGPVPLKLKIPGSVPGDSATVATLLNHIVVAHEATPGLLTPRDVRPAGCANLNFKLTTE